MPRALLTTALLLLAVACSNDPTGGGTPPATIRIDGNNAGASDGLVFISQGGQSVSDGSVTVTANGVAATPTNGGYFWQLATPLAAGATLTIEATRLGATARVVGTLPATPILVAPAVNAPVNPGTPLTVTWTAASDPDYFLIHLGYRVGSTGASVGDSVRGDVRTLELATGDIPAGATNLSIDIRAVGTETRSGDVTADSRLRLYTTTGDRSLTNGPAPILIDGRDMGTQFQNFTISRGGGDVSAAVVSINGVTIPTQASGSYSYNIGSLLTAGEELVVRVELDGDIVEGRATIPPLAVITQPVDAQVVTSGPPITYAWTAATDPDWWTMDAFYTTASSGGGNLQGDSLAADARGGLLPTTMLPTSNVTSIQARLYAYLRGSFTGPADPASTMRVRVPANSVTLTPSP